MLAVIQAVESTVTPCIIQESEILLSAKKDRSL
jgi:hypothetical protein